MEKISIFIVFLLWLCCFDAQGRVCNFDKYYKPGQGCVKCPACPPGKELAQHCGHNNAGLKVGQDCSSCIAGMTYNGKEGGVCKACQGCRVELKACTLTSNAVCGCPKGMYMSSDGDCEKCSYCCGENWEQNSKNIEPSCQAQGLGRCICKRSLFCSGNCRSPTTASITTRTNQTTAPITTRTTTTTMTTPTTSPRSKRPKHNATQIQTAPVIFTTPGLSYDDPKAQRDEKPVYPFLKPGWVVLICLGGVLAAGLVALMSCHKRTRKQISGICCRKYVALSPDVETLVEGHHEGRYEEQATRTTENNAQPIPPEEEPLPPIFYSGITAEVYCSCRTRETDVEQKQCACTMDTSETSLEKLPHNSSSAETISEEQEPVRETSSWRISPSTSSSSRLSSPRTSECYCLTPSSSSNCVTASPSRGRSPECYRETPISNQSTFVSLTPPRERYPEHNRMTSSSNSTHVTPPPRERSPAHRCLTPSPCVTPTSSRGQSPDPSFLRSVQSCSSFADDQEICNQSSEYTQSNDPVPISVEAHDKERDQDASKSARKDTSSAPGKRKQSRSVVRRNSPSPKKGVDCVPSYELKMKEILFPKQTGDADKNVPPISNSDRGQGHNVMATNDNDMNQANIADSRCCKYRRIQRDEDAEHRCTECCPQPHDSFFKLINRERTCLKEEICKELNKCNSYKELARFARVELKMEEYETSSLNPAERVLDRIKASEPSLKLAEFEEMLRQLDNKRLDIVNLIQDHHISCTFCQRNRFDPKA